MNTGNPYRFYGVSGSACITPLNLVNAENMEFHGASFWGSGTSTTGTISITGTHSGLHGYILFDGLQDGPSDYADMYLNQQNITVICAANCLFGDADQTGLATSPGAIVVGPLATTIATGVSPIILQLDQGIIDAPSVQSVGTDIYFQTGPECHCVVALGSGMVDVNTALNSSQPGAPTTNDPTKLTGQTTYAAPTFANAATVGVPLTLNPNELGMGVSTDTLTHPGASGLKLRVECSTAHPGTARIVALAGSSTTPTIVADNIGTCP